jgi:hypothetical protein
MVILNAHFDGKVIVPDEPLALEPNQKLRVSIEPIGSEPKRNDFSHWLGLGLPLPANHKDRFTSNDQLWEKDK